jgi:hypothetical protein
VRFITVCTVILTVDAAAHQQCSERKDIYAMYYTLVDNTSCTTSTIEALEYLWFSALVENP